MSRQKVFKIVSRMLVVAVGLFAASAAGLVLSGLNDNIQPSDVAVVLGNHVEPNGKPSARLQARLDKTVELYQQGIFQNIIVSGGIDSAGNDEGLAMKRYLIDRGLPSTKIYADSAGDNTYLTAKNTAQLMSARKWQSVMVISQYFHIPRTSAILHRLGVKSVYSAHANFFEWRDIYSTAREVVGYVSYLAK